MEAAIKFTTSVIFDGTAYYVRINNTDLPTKFRSKSSAVIIEKFLKNNIQAICDAISWELEK